MNKIRRFAAFALVLALMLLTVFVPAVHAEETLGPDEAKHSVFRVVTKDASGAVISFGSTFAVGEQSPVTYLLTNYHVVSENESGVYIWMDQDKEIKCEVAMALTDRDLAILKLETPVEAEPLPLGTEDMVKTGDDVYALGYPTNDISNTLTSYPEDVTVTKGIISKTANWNGVRYYQVDAAINQGNSGGPLLHKNGYVVGVASMKMNDTEGINGAIRIEEALDALDSLGIRVKMAVPTVAGMTQTPEQFVAENLVRAGTVAVLAVPVAFLSKFLAVLLLAAAILLYRLGSMTLRKKIGARRARIELELPRFVANIEKTLPHSRDVLAMLESYRTGAGEEFGRELDITVADMRSGNDEAALTRLEARVGSSALSDVVRGLIGILHGEDNSVYWANLSLKFSEAGRQNLREQAGKVPKRVRRLSLVLLGCFFLIYIVVIGEVLLNSLGGLFL